jgi:hypothetical protein
VAGWPTWLRVAALVVLAFLVWGSLVELDAWTGSTAVLVGCAVVWLALAVRAWFGGRVALFVAIVPVFVMPAALVGVNFAGPACGIRPIGPEVRTREGEQRLLPVPHEVCRVTLADGSRVTDGGPPRYFFIAFGWAALATALALAHRPSLLVRAEIVVVTWFLAAFALFI